MLPIMTSWLLLLVIACHLLRILEMRKALLALKRRDDGDVFTKKDFVFVMLE